MSIVGARPQFIKLAPIAAAFDGTQHGHSIIHTGQHYDAAMSEKIFSSLSIPDVDVHLGIGSGSHGVQTGRMLADIEAVLIADRPDWVLVYGDTNSTLAATLAATKLDIPVAHIEAGLRSFNRLMPEEQNRVVADHLSDLLFAPTTTAVDNLRAEGLSERTRLVGDVMADVCLQVSRGLIGPPDLPAGAEPGAYVVATLHRPSNTDNADRLEAVMEYLSRIPAPVVLAAHPRLTARAVAHGIRLERPGLLVREPFDYPDLVAAVAHSAAVVTDSGGLQKEAYLLGRPCTTLRAETEWLETLEHDANRLDPELADPDSVVRAAPPEDRTTFFGDGTAARQIVAELGR